MVERQPAGRMCCYLKIKEEVDIGEKLFKFLESTWVHLTDENTGDTFLIKEETIFKTKKVASKVSISRTHT